MSAPTWEQIIDAVIVGDARIGPYIAQQIVKADNAPKQPLPAIIVEIPAKHEEPRLHQQSDMADVANVDAAPLADGGVSGGVVNGLDDDQMEWLGAFAGPHLPTFDHIGVNPTADGRAKRLARLERKDVDASPLSDETAGVKAGWVDGEQSAIAKLSPERKRVWQWLKTINVTHDEPSCHDAASMTGVSHQTCNKALKQYRAFHGLTDRVDALSTQ